MLSVSCSSHSVLLKDRIAAQCSLTPKLTGISWHPNPTAAEGGRWLSTLAKQVLSDHRHRRAPRPAWDRLREAQRGRGRVSLSGSGCQEVKMCPPKCSIKQAL